jgi:radical SAM protein with 4Fe4S-binding SPASM domain
MIIRDTGRKDRLSRLVIDPGTQRWIVADELCAGILRLCDGSRSADQINDIIRRQTIKKVRASDVAQSLTMLKNKGFVFEGEEAYCRVCSPIYLNAKIVGVHLEVTNRCNLRCTHCYLTSGSPCRDELSTTETKGIISELCDLSGKRICITGGEPLLREDIFEILEYATVDKELITDLYTNATLIDDNVAKRLHEISDRSKKGLYFQVSLEGATEETNDKVRGKGTFRKVIKSIKTLTRHELNRQIVLFVCVSKGNIHQANDLIRLAEKLDVCALKFSSVYKQGRASRQGWEDRYPCWKEWVKLGHELLNYKGKKVDVSGSFYGDLKNTPEGLFSLTSPLFPRFSCALKIFPRIDCQGNVWPCQLFVDPEIIVGNIRKASLADIFERRKYRRLFLACASRTQHVQQCEACTWKALCSCGCPGIAYSEYGTLNSHDRFCNVRRYWLEEYAKNCTSTDRTRPAVNDIISRVESQVRLSSQNVVSDQKS